MAHECPQNVHLHLWSGPTTPLELAVFDCVTEHVHGPLDHSLSLSSQSKLSDVLGIAMCASSFLPFCLRLGLTMAVLELTL